MMVSPKVVQERGPDLERNARGAGTGPFEFVEWVKDDHILLKRNENYWNKQAGPYLDQIRYRPIPDDTVKLASLQSGEIDVMDYVQPRDVAAVKADKNLVEVDVPSLAQFSYVLNHTKPPFNNRALRQAVISGLDIEQIVKGVWLGVGVPSNGPIPPSSSSRAFRPREVEIAFRPALVCRRRPRAGPHRRGSGRKSRCASTWWLPAFDRLAEDTS